MKPGNDLGRAGLRLSTLCDLLASNPCVRAFPFEDVGPKGRRSGGRSRSGHVALACSSCLSPEAQDGQAVRLLSLLIVFPRWRWRRPHGPFQHSHRCSRC
jgi:hypothetical protein